ncbi:LLM class flavin-dependent oxidoreductase [Streptomyces misionensis]
MLHLAAAVEPPEGPGAGPYAELARLAEHGRLDFVTLGEPAGRSGPEALDLLGRVVPATRRIGLVPALAEPWPAPAALAGADWIGRGRAGWRIVVPRAGARPPARRVAGPASRPPHGHPVRVVDADTKQGRTAAARYADVALVPAETPAQAAAVCDELRSTATASGRDPAALRVLVSLRVDLGGGEQAAEPGHGGGGPRPSPMGPLYRGGPVDLAELVASWHTEGAADGFHLVPVEPRRDLERLVNGTVALLQHRGLFRTFYPGATLREHLGLARGENATRRTGGQKEEMV